HGKTASNAWRAGSTRPSAKAAGGHCGCPRRRWDRRAAPTIATPACARWRCCPKREAAMAARADSMALRPAKDKPAPSMALDPQSRLWTLAAAAACLLPLLLQLPGTMAIVIAVLGVAIAATSHRHRLPAWLRLLLALALLGYVMASSQFAL